MLDADKSLLERIYPDGIPSVAINLLDRTQRIRHQYSIGHLDGNTMALLCAMADMMSEPVKPEVEVEAISSPIPTEPEKVEQEEFADDDGYGDLLSEEEDTTEPPEPAPKKTNWFAVKGGTPVECVVESTGEILIGEFLSTIRKGSEKGHIRVDIPEYVEAFTVFKPENVKIIE